MTALDPSVRTALLAQLAEHPALVAVKEVLSSALTYQRINLDDPQWAAKAAYQHGQNDVALLLIRAIEKAAETVKLKVVP